MMDRTIIILAIAAMFSQRTRGNPFLPPHSEINKDQSNIPSATEQADTELRNLFFNELEHIKSSTAPTSTHLTTPESLNTTGKPSEAMDQAKSSYTKAGFPAIVSANATTASPSSSLKVPDV